MQSPRKYVMGIDISKDSLHVQIVQKGEPIILVGKTERFSQDRKGYRQMEQWGRRWGVTPENTYVVMEATGVYWERCAYACWKRGYAVGVVNPARVRYYARSLLRRGKTDRLDAEVNARFGATEGILAWNPPDPMLEKIKEFFRYREAHVEMCSQEKHRLEALRHQVQVPREILRSTEQHIAYLEKQIDQLSQWIQACWASCPVWKEVHELLRSVPGMGEVTAGVLLAETQGLAPFLTSAQLVSYAGLSPAPCESGSSVKGKTRISKIGNARIRQMMFMAALSAIRDQGVFSQFYQRLRTKGKPVKVALIAVARKLLRVLFAVVKSCRPYNPCFQSTKSIQ